MNHKVLLLFSVCTISLSHYMLRVLGTPIYGGTVDHRHSFKYHVSLHKINLEKRDYEYFCGGTIIQEKYILTAAHCFMLKHDDHIVFAMNLVTQKPKIIAGTNKREGTGVESAIVTIFIPHTYTSSPNKNDDIAVAKLKNNLNVASNKRKLEIMPLGELLPNDQANEQALLCGFGFYEVQPGQVSEVFSKLNQFLTITLLSVSECPESQEKICAISSDKSGIHTACFGDDGAGLIIDNRIVGVFSYGPKYCNSNRVPMVFTRLAQFKDAIYRAMDDDADHDDMFVVFDYHSTPFPSLNHQASGASSSHHDASYDKRKKGSCYPKCFD